MTQIGFLGTLGLRFLYWRLPVWVEKMPYVPALNYGYMGSNGSFFAETENGAQLRLYHRVAGSFLLGHSQHPLEVVEVGSGLGVGALWLSSFLKDGLRSFQGIDKSRAAVKFCERRYAGNAKLQFQQGDAMSLPLEDESVDALINVESSHMYPDMEGFLAESFRVIKPGGYFLWADFRRADEQGKTLRAIAENYAILEQEDITAGVLGSLESEEEERRKGEYLTRLLRSLSLPERAAMRLSLKYVRNFMGMKGSGIAHGFQTRNLVYLRVVAQKASS
ncbi:MAG: class I SAM-dependent methyltransferase [bacterium]|nr:class I SAM-dependent methyltransferase [bacterium]